MSMEASFTFRKLCDGCICNQSKIFLLRATVLSASLCKLFLFGELIFEGLSNGSSVLLSFHFGFRKAAV